MSTHRARVGVAWAVCAAGLLAAGGCVEATWLPTWLGRDAWHAAESAPDTLVLTRQTRLPLRYRQGVARTSGGWIFSSNNGLFRTDEAGTEILARAPAIPRAWRSRGYDHIGDVDVVGDTLYAPLEQPDYRRGRQALLVIDALRLEVRSGIELAQHEMSFVCVDPDSGIAYSMDRFGGQALLRYAVGEAWRPLEPLALSRRVERVQGGDVSQGAIWLSTDDGIQGVYRVDLATGQVDLVGTISSGAAEIQGLDADPRGQGALRILVLDFVPIPGVRALDLLRLPTTPQDVHARPLQSNNGIGPLRRVSNLALMSFQWERTMSLAQGRRTLRQSPRRASMPSSPRPSAPSLH